MDSFFVHHVHEGQINALQVTKDGTRAFSGGQDGKVISSRLVKSAKAASAGARTIETKVLLTGTKPVLALALSPDEKKLLIAQFSCVVVYDLEREVITNVLTRVKGRILSLAWDPRGELVVLGRASGDIFVWNLTIGPRAGKDSERALESYQASTSPIVALAFHPSGRAFFAAERDGSMFLWRLLRTERELGLRDESADSDRARAGRTAVRVGSFPSAIEDVWLSKNGAALFISTSDGFVYRYKVRGLRSDEKFMVGADTVFSVRGIEVQDPQKRYSVVSLLATSGRGQRLKLWCQDPGDAASDIPGVPSNLTILQTEKPEPEAPVADDDLFELETSERKAEPVEQQKPTPAGFVGQTAVFRNPLVLLRGGERYPLLWAAEKTGNLLTFDADSLLRLPAWRARAERCEG